MLTRWRAARRDSGEDVTEAAPSEATAVSPAAGASKAAVRCRLERRVGATAAWGLSKGKAFLSGSVFTLGGA